MQMIVNVANSERVAALVYADVMTPPPPVDYLGWAEANIVFSQRESPMPGPYNRDLFFYFDEILRALSPDDPCRVVTLRKSAQLGGTVLANIFCGGSMDMAAGDFLYVHPTENNAQRWSKMKLSPMLKGTTAVAARAVQAALSLALADLTRTVVKGAAAVPVAERPEPDLATMDRTALAALKADLQAEMLEIERDRLTGKLIDIAALSASMIDRFAAARARALAMHVRSGPACAMADAGAALAILERDMREIVEQLAGGYVSRADLRLEPVIGAPLAIAPDTGLAG